LGALGERVGVRGKEANSNPQAHRRFPELPNFARPSRRAGGFQFDYEKICRLIFGALFFPR